jgi:hypothetical protein
MNINFNDLPWHDANLQSIYIDRQKPGEQDNVKLLIDWPDGKCSSIEFCDCYALNAHMNFGIVACESILTAEYFIDSEELSSIRNQWSKVGINLEGLQCFKIITNSTNSIINIFALSFRVINANESNGDL